MVGGVRARKKKQKNKKPIQCNPLKWAIGGGTDGGQRKEAATYKKWDVVLAG